MPQSLLQSFQTTSLTGPGGALLLESRTADASRLAGVADGPTEDSGVRNAFLRQLLNLLGPPIGNPAVSGKAVVDGVNTRPVGRVMDSATPPEDDTGGPAAAVTLILPLAAPLTAVSPVTGATPPLFAAVEAALSVPVAPQPLAGNISPSTPEVGQPETLTSAFGAPAPRSVDVTALATPEVMAEGFTPDLRGNGLPTAGIVSPNLGNIRPADKDSPASIVAPTPLPTDAATASQPAGVAEAMPLASPPAAENKMSDFPTVSPTRPVPDAASAPAFELQVADPMRQGTADGAASSLVGETPREAATVAIAGTAAPLTGRSDSLTKHRTSRPGRPSGAEQQAVAGRADGSSPTPLSGLPPVLPLADGSADGPRLSLGAEGSTSLISPTAPHPSAPAQAASSAMASPPLATSARPLARDEGGKTPSTRSTAANAGSHAAASLDMTSGLARHTYGATGQTPVVNAANSDTAPTGQTIANPFHATSPDHTAGGASNATAANTATLTNTPDAILGNRMAADGSALASSVTETPAVHHAAHATRLGGDRPTAITEAAQRPFQVPEPPAHQLEIQLARHAAAGRSHFTLRLDPPELGRVQVSLQFSGDGRVEAAIRTDHPHALDLLQRDARLLERALSQAGFRTEGGLQFSLNQHSSQQQPGHGHPGGGDLSGQNGTGDGTGGENPQGHGSGVETTRQTGEEGGLHDANEAAHGDGIIETGNGTVKEEMIRLPDRLDIEV